MPRFGLYWNAIGIKLSTKKLLTRAIKKAGKVKRYIFGVAHLRQNHFYSFIQRIWVNCRTPS